MKIGITGVYASGKGTVCSILEELGAVSVDADLIAREIFEPGNEALEKLINAFGNHILNPDGTLNRAGTAEIVFNDYKKLTILNDISHPIILKIILDRTADESKIFAINVPLLFETGFHVFMDKTVVVTSNQDQILKRGLERDNFDEKKVMLRLKYQIPLNEKIKSADHIIDNSLSIEDTKRQVSELWNILSKT